MIDPLAQERVRHAQLRDLDRWVDVSLAGLEVLPDGTIELRRLPAVAPPELQSPGDVTSSGLALDDHCGLYIIDGSERRLIRVALDCCDRQIVPGRHGAAGWFQEPRGICIGPFGWLFVADASAGRVLVLSTPELAFRDSWSAGLSRPIAVAPAGDRGVYVLDEGLGRVLRYDPFGAPDDDFNSKPVPAQGSPAAIAATTDGALCVGVAGGVERFTPTGDSAGPRIARRTRPQALAVDADVLYVADGLSGQIHLVSLPSGDELGVVEGFRGPVSALAGATDRRLYVKRGAADEYFVAEPGMGRAPRGTLTTDAPLSAGEEAHWWRATADSDTPEGSAVVLEVAGEPANVAPRWKQAAASDTLVEPLLGWAGSLSLRVTLVANEAGQSPTLYQVRAETFGDPYSRYLPAVYTRDPETSGPLEQLLAVAKAQLGDLEGEIALIARRFRAATASAEDLERLADWLAFPLPELVSATQDPGRVRALLDEVPELDESRGTPRGLRRALEIYAGVRVDIFEDFRARGVWQLGDAPLGFETQLAPAAVDGTVVGSSAVGTSGPESAETWGSALFAETAHRFSVVMPAAHAPTADDQRRVRATVEREKPAHASYHLCFAGPKLRVGFQARVGLDSIVGVPDETFQLDGPTRLGVDSRTAAEDGGFAASVGRSGRVGLDALVG